MKKRHKILKMYNKEICRRHLEWVTAATKRHSTTLRDNFSLAHVIQAAKNWHDVLSPVCCRKRVLLLLHFLQRVPLRDWSARVCEHVAPVSQLGARWSAAKRDAANWVRGTNAIVVHHRNDQRHFLQTFKVHTSIKTSQWRKMKMRVELWQKKWNSLLLYSFI